MLTLQDVIFLIVSGGVLILLERLLPLHPGQRLRRPGWQVDVLHLFLTGTLIRLGTTLAVLVASVCAFSVVPETIRDAVRAQPDWVEFVQLLLLSDLCFYVAHRTCHAVPFLWRFHAVHHSSERLDWLATYRVHPVDQILNSTVIALPAIVLGFSPLPLLIYAMVYRLHSPLLHSNIGLDFGWLGRIFTSPRFHHWHHADQVEAYDRNFGGQLTIFDRLFGTHHEAGERTLPTRYGIGGAIPETYASHLLQPFHLTARTDDLPRGGPVMEPRADQPLASPYAEPATSGTAPVKRELDRHDAQSETLV